MTKLQISIANTAICALMLCALVVLGQDASVAPPAVVSEGMPSSPVALDAGDAATVPAPCPPRPVPRAQPPLPLATRLEHLLQAAVHLEAAGESQQAAQVRKLVASEGKHASVAVATKAPAAGAALPAAAPQQVLVKLKVCEISRSRMRELGLDLPKGLGGNSPATPAAPAAPTGSLWVLEEKKAVLEILDTLREKSLLRMLAEPTIVTVSGRPTCFQSGGQVPIARPAPDGSAVLEMIDFGTRVDLVAIVTAPDRLHLEVRMQVSEIDEAHSVKVGDTLTPAIRMRSVNTGAEIQSGQALLIGGLVQQKPKPAGPSIAADEPVKTAEDVELLFVVMPEIIDGIEMAQAHSAGAE